MSSNRLSGLNVALLAVTVLALMFGAYGFINGGMNDSRPRINSPVSDHESEASDRHSADDAAPLADRDRVRPRTPRDGDRQPPPSHTNANLKASSVSSEDPLGELTVEVDSDPSDQGDAGLSGRVIGPDSQPVPGATVTARRSDLEMSPPQLDDGGIEAYREKVAEFLQRTASETRTTTTNTEGRFSFAGLDPSLAYNLTATSESGNGEQSRVAAGDSVVILIAEEATFSGRVQDSEGNPVEEFTVRAWRTNRQWEAVSRSFDDEQGRFDMPARGGEMELEVTATGYTQAEPVEVHVGEASTEVVITLQTAATLTGVVTDKDGNPLGNVSVRVGDAGGGMQRNRWNGWNRGRSGPSTETDSKGRYRFDSLKPEETTVEASRGEMSASEETTLASGENTLDIQLDTGAVVRIHVTSPDGRPAVADSVSFQPAEGRGWSRPERLPARKPGLVEYAGLEPGEYKLSVTSSGFPTVQQDVNLKDGENDINVQLSNGATLTGTISGTSGSSVPNLSVRLRMDDEQGWSRRAGTFARVDEDGTFELGPVDAGQWNFEVYATQGSWRRVYSNVVSLVQGENSHDAVVDSGATVVVRVVDNEGNAVNWSRIQLRGESNYNQRTDSEGTATVSFVEVGNYTLTASGRGLASRVQMVSPVNGNNEYTVTLKEPNCCRLTNVRDGTQAHNAGLKEGDIVVRYNGQDIKSWRAFGQAVRATTPEDELEITVERNGTLLTYELRGGTVGVDGTDAVR